MPYQSVFRDGLFAGRIVIVTGGGSGIGRCTAHELASLGATVAIWGRTAEKLEAVRGEIEADGAGAVRMSATSGMKPRSWPPSTPCWRSMAASTAW